MRAFWLSVSIVLTMSAVASARDKPTGAPLVLSSIETEQPVPLTVMSPDGKNASCVMIRMHWTPVADTKADTEATSFTLDMAADNPGASIFTAQLWNASLASALAWQAPWQGASWKIFQVPPTDGTGIDGALAVGMISTSARRPYPKETAVMGSLNPDGSFGPVSHLVARLDAASAAGITRVIIPSVQRFDTDDSGQVVNVVRHASDLHLECVPVDNLVEATEVTMNDPLPELTLDAAPPKYGNSVASYVDEFAKREEAEANNGLQFAPKVSDLSRYPPKQAAVWKKIHDDIDLAEGSYRAGQVYVAYNLFVHANSRMHGMNALSGQSRATFDVKAALAESDDLRKQVHDLMNPPAIDHAELESALVVAEMADWAYEMNANLEGAALVTKQTFSQRTDATEAEKDRARETILFANEEAKYLVNQQSFYTGLLPLVQTDHPLPAEGNAANLLPQLIPAQLAMAQMFTEGIRPRASELRDGLLFDPRLVSYVTVMREMKADWDARQRKKTMETTNAADAAKVSTGEGPAKLNTGAELGNAAFDPGGTYGPPRNSIDSAGPTLKTSSVAQCLIWVNTDCEVATLDEKYLKLGGTIDPVTREWHLKERAKLDALLQLAEVGARQGIAFADKVQLDTAVLSMIYEKATQQRLQGDDTVALEALRNYWRCALLGNMCWQLAHSHKAQAVDLSAESVKNDDKASDKSADVKDKDKSDDKTADTKTDKEKTKKDDDSVAASTKKTDQHASIDKASSKGDASSESVENPSPSDKHETPPAPVVHTETPVPPAQVTTENPGPAPVVPESAVVIPVPAPVPAVNTPEAPPAPERVSPVVLPAPPTPGVVVDPDANIPVARIAKPEDYGGGSSIVAPTTNAPPVALPDNSGGSSPSSP